MKQQLVATWALGIAVLFGCSTNPQQPNGPGDPCDNTDGALSDASFVLVSTPDSGERVKSGFAVRGCSRTFESVVNWRLTGFNGTVLAQGFTNGGGVDGFGPFNFNVGYTIGQRQFGYLEVFEEDASGGEGFPPSRNVLPLILQP